jgi:Meckel syndrome type 1 protein
MVADDDPERTPPAAPDATAALPLLPPPPPPAPALAPPSRPPTATATAPTEQASGAMPGGAPIGTAGMAPVLAATRHGPAGPAEGADAPAVPPPGTTASQQGAVAPHRMAHPPPGAAAPPAQGDGEAPSAAAMPQAGTGVPAADVVAPPQHTGAPTPLEPRPAAADPRRVSEAAAPMDEHAFAPAAGTAPSQGATTHAEPPRAPPQAAPARQVTPAVIAVAIGGGGRISVTLEPVELGRVEISVERGADAPQVVILAERPETLALLQRDQRELDRALTQAGLPGEGRAISFGLSGGDAGAGQPQQRREEAARDGAPRGDGPARGVQGHDTNAGAAAAPRRAARSLLDLAI